MSDVFEIAFPSTSAAQAIRVKQFSDLPQVLRALGLLSSRPVIVLIGGAGGMTEFDYTQLRPLFNEALAPLAEELGAVVIDGGTDSGVMQLIGQARAEGQYHFPLIGLIVEKLVALPDQDASEDQSLLEPNHTHFILLPGSDWGEESIWISQAASILAGPLPSVAILINGGEIAYEDVQRNVEQRRLTIIIDGSGRTADVLAATMRGEQIDPRATELVATGLLKTVHLSAGPTALVTTTKKIMHKE